MAYLEQEPEFIGVAVHSNDPMEVQNYNFLIGTYMDGGGFPGAMFDRDNESGFNGITSLFAEFNKRKAYAVPCEVKNLALSIDSSTNEINISGETEWFGNIRGDYRLSCIIVEDDVIGTTSRWFQANAYAGGGNGPQQFPGNVNNGFDFTTAQNPANPTGFGGYDHVARYLSSGDLLGDVNSLPTGEIPMGTYAYTFAPIPASVVSNMTKAQAVVMVVDKYTGDILNAKKIPLISSTTSMNALQDKVDWEVFPNPAQDLVQVSFETKKPLSTVNIVLNDTHGKEVVRVTTIGNNGKVTLPTEQLGDGIYLVRLISDGQTIAIKKLVIAR